MSAKNGALWTKTTMYEEFHLQQKWPLEFYKACLLFLDYPEGEYPLEEEEMYKAFNKKRGAITQQQKCTTTVWVNPYHAPHVCFQVVSRVVLNSLKYSQGSEASRVGARTSSRSGTTREQSKKGTKAGSRGKTNVIDLDSPIRKGKQSGYET